MALAAIFSPLRYTEFDQRDRHIQFTNWWLWGYGRSKIIGFDEIASADVQVSRGSESPDTYFPRVILKSGKTKLLSFEGGSAPEAECAVREIRSVLGLVEHG